MLDSIKFLSLGPRCSVWESSSRVSDTYNINTPLTITGVTGTAVQPKENTKESRHCRQLRFPFLYYKDIATSILAPALALAPPAQEPKHLRVEAPGPDIPAACY